VGADRSPDQIMENENPKYLTCPFCPSQSYLRIAQAYLAIYLKYQCPAHHTFYIEQEKKEEKESE